MRSRVRKYTPAPEPVALAPVLTVVEAKPEESSPALDIEEAKNEIYNNHNSQSLEAALQHLWKLDKLERLIYLAELSKLDRLENLNKLDGLAHLDELKELHHLKELKGLNKLKDIKGLDQLNHLLRLKHLDKLDGLKELDKLSAIENLDKLSQLDKLIYLNKLESLKKLDKLDGLSKVSELKTLLEEHSENFDKFSHLTHLDKLDNLKRLENLNKLSDLENLQALGNLERLAELKSLDKLSNLQSLYKLDKLEGLSSLERLTKLDQLHYLEKLDNMQDLSKLDTLKDEEVKKSLGYLSKLEYFQGTNKQFLLKLILSSVFDISKIAIGAVLLLFILIKNVSYQTINRLVPYVGFGEADRVNIALSILSHDLATSDFDKLYKNLEMRVKREASILFNPSTPKGLNEYYIAENLVAYSYTNANYDLAAFSIKERKDWADKSLKKFGMSYDYDVERLGEEAEMQTDVTSYREASIFMKQQKYLEALASINKIKNPQRFESLGAARAYAFYMAFLLHPKELKTFLEK